MTNYNSKDLNKISPVSQTPDSILKDKLEQLIPEAFSEGKLNVETLKAVLGDNVLAPNFESYGLNWAGKHEVYGELKTPTSQTLTPQPDESVDFDSTQNLFIEGDNLAVLKILQKSYYNRIKMIYIDPPYNTGNDRFIYPDDYSESLAEYQARAGQLDDDGNLTHSDGMRSNRKENGQYHSNWLNMMYPRLALAKNLLRDDGVIFVSIDDNEVANLRLLMDEIFGEESFVAEIVVKRSSNGMGSQFGFSSNHDYILCYVKNSFTKDGVFFGLTPTAEYINKFDKEDEFGKYKADGILNKKGEGARREDSPGCFYPIFYNPNSGKVVLEERKGFLEKLPVLPNGDYGRWVWSKEFAADKLHRLYASKNGTIYIKDYYNSSLRMKPKTILEKKSYLTNIATNELKVIFDEKIFDTPKPTELLKDLVDASTTKSNDIILDFFAGSSTTAHAIMALNAEEAKNNEDKEVGKRKFIMVQIPEAIDPKDNKNAYEFCHNNNLPPTISEISKERIRRAGQQIIKDNPYLADSNIDIGLALD